MAETRTIIRRTQGPSDAEWENIRPFFKQLYRDENRPLKDVSQILRSRYGFVATDKMFKVRRRKWGLDKKHKAREMVFARHKITYRKALGKQTQVTVRGLPVSEEEIERYFKRGPSQAFDTPADPSTPSELDYCTPRSLGEEFEVWDPIGKPENLELPLEIVCNRSVTRASDHKSKNDGEDIYNFIQQYLRFGRQIQASQTSSDLVYLPSDDIERPFVRPHPERFLSHFATYYEQFYFGSDALKECLNRKHKSVDYSTYCYNAIFSALDDLRSNNFTRAGMTLDHASSHFKAMLIQQYPRMVLDILLSTRRLSLFGYWQVSQILLQQIYQLSEIISGATHPLTLCILALIQESAEDFEYLAFDFAIHTYAKEFGHKHPITIAIIYEYINLSINRTEPKHALQMVLSLLKILEGDMEIGRSHCLHVYMHAFLLHSRLGNYGAAEELLKRAKNHWEEHKESLPLDHYLFLLDYEGDFYFMQNRHMEAIKTCQKALDFCDKELYIDDFRRADVVKSIYHYGYEDKICWPRNQQNPDFMSPDFDHDSHDTAVILYKA